MGRKKLPDAYLKVVEDLKVKISRTQIRAVLTANIHLLAIYYEIGSTIAAQEHEQGWGAKTVERLSEDLKSAFPQMKGLSSRNLRYMRDFARAWPELHALQLVDDRTVAKDLILQQPVAKLPWGHCCVLLDRLDSADERRFYAQKAVENGWSRNVLVNHMESGLYGRHGRLQNNFNNILPAEQSDLIRELFKDPYKFDFLNLGDEAQEREVEKALTDHILKFLLEMGRHFAFVGRQVHLQVGESDFYVDVLLYHTKIHAYIALELKLGEFKPDYVGKMGFYLSAIDSDYKTEMDGPSIGIILCRSKDKVVVEYALRDINKPMGVSEYTVTKHIPKELKSELPYIERLREELVRDIELSKKAIDQKLASFKVIADKDL